MVDQVILEATEKPEIFNRDFSKLIFDQGDNFEIRQSLTAEVIYRFNSTWVQLKESYSWMPQDLLAIKVNDGIERVIRIVGDQIKLVNYFVNPKKIDIEQEENIEELLEMDEDMLEGDEAEIIECRVLERLEATNNDYKRQLIITQAAKEGRPNRLFTHKKVGARFVSVSSISFYLWQLIEKLVDGSIQVRSLNQRIIQQLSFTIMPNNGQTCLHYLIQNYENLDAFYDLTFNEEGKIFDPPFLPDFEDKTPMHLALNNPKVADKFLNVLSSAPLDHHIRFFDELLPKFVEMGLPNLRDYFDGRFFQTAQYGEISRLALVTNDESVPFGLAPGTIWAEDMSKIKNALSSDKDDSQVPVMVELLDLPMLFKF